MHAEDAVDLDIIGILQHIEKREERLLNAITQKRAHEIVNMIR